MEKLNFNEILNKHRNTITNTIIREKCMQFKAELLRDNKLCLCGSKNLTSADDPRVCRVLENYVKTILLNQAYHDAKKEFSQSSSKGQQSIIHQQQHQMQ